MNRQYFVYMMANKTNRVLYTGVTGNLERRIAQHKTKTVPGFTAIYNCNKLVWYAETNDVQAAIEEEKRIKKGSRAKKDQLIESMNPDWDDLASDW